MPTVGSTPGKRLSYLPASGPGELKIDRVGKFKLFPDEDVQNYVERVGRSLIPDYQSSLPDDDPGRIPFKFYVVEEQEPNAFALANGTVVVHSGLLEILNNEAQLAAVMGHEIAHSTHEHTWRQTQFHNERECPLWTAALMRSAESAIAVCP